MRRVGQDAKPVGAGTGLWRDATGAGVGAVVADDLPDALVVADTHARITLINARAAKLLGILRDESVGRSVVEALPLVDECGRSWWDVAAPWSGLRTRTGHRERPLTIPGRGRALVTMRYVRPARNAPVERVVITMRPWFEQCEHDGLAARYADLLAIAAHELRSPLTSVRGFSATLLRQWDRFTDEQRRAMVATVEADADRLSRLIAQLLDVSRLSARRLMLDTTVLDLHGLVDEQVRRLIRSGVDPARFAVPDSPDDGGDHVLVCADRERVEQIVTNLLDNALTHGAGTITLATDTDDRGMVGLTVTDEGPGIDPAHERHVFAKFWRGGRPGSTGLGLYLVKGLVEAHGGTVSVGPGRASEPRGARFRVTLPAAS